MTVFLRFRDLKARNIVSNWVQLRRMIDLYGFPPGKKLGPNTTAWDSALVEQWLDSRPHDTKPWPASAKRDGAKVAA